MKGQLSTDAAGHLQQEIDGLESDINTKIGTTDISSVGDGTITGAVSALNNGLTHLYHVETCSLKNCTISADTYQTFNVPTVEVAGFKPISLVGFWTDNSASGGGNTTSVMFNNLNVNDGNVYTRVRNLASSSAKVDIFVRVLYLPRNMSDN